MSQAEERYAHLLQPIRDLAANWNVSIAEELSEYLDALDDITFSFSDGRTFNFAEAALVIQGSACVYGRKVEYLHALVYQALEEIGDRKERGSAAAEGAASRGPRKPRAAPDAFRLAAERLLEEEAEDWGEADVAFLSLDDVIDDEIREGGGKGGKGVGEGIDLEDEAEEGPGGRIGGLGGDEDAEDEDDYEDDYDGACDDDGGPDRDGELTSFSLETTGGRRGDDGGRVREPSGGEGSDGGRACEPSGRASSPGSEYALDRSTRRFLGVSRARGLHALLSEDAGEGKSDQGGSGAFALAACALHPSGALVLDVGRLDRDAFGPDGDGDGADAASDPKASRPPRGAEREGPVGGEAPPGGQAGPQDASGPEASHPASPAPFDGDDGGGAAYDEAATDAPFDDVAPADPPDGDGDAAPAAACGSAASPRALRSSARLEAGAERPAASGAVASRAAPPRAPRDPYEPLDFGRRDAKAERPLRVLKRHPASRAGRGGPSVPGVPAALAASLAASWGLAGLPPAAAAALVSAALPLTGEAIARDLRAWARGGASLVRALAARRGAVVLGELEGVRAQAERLGRRGGGAAGGAASRAARRQRREREREEVLEVPDVAPVPLELPEDVEAWDRDAGVFGDGLDGGSVGGGADAGAGGSPFSDGGDFAHQLAMAYGGDDTSRDLFGAGGADGDPAPLGEGALSRDLFGGAADPAAVLAEQLASYEELCRAHVDAALQRAAKAAQSSDAARRVAAWRDRIEPEVDAVVEREAFDPEHEGERVLERLWAKERELSAESAVGGAGEGAESTVGGAGEGAESGMGGAGKGAESGVEGAGKGMVADEGSETAGKGHGADAVASSSPTSPPFPSSVLPLSLLDAVPPGATAQGVGRAFAATLQLANEGRVDLVRLGIDDADGRAGAETAEAHPPSRRDRRHRAHGASEAGRDGDPHPTAWKDVEGPLPFDPTGRFRLVPLDRGGGAQQRRERIKEALSRPEEEGDQAQAEGRAQGDGAAGTEEEGVGGARGETGRAGARGARTAAAAPKRGRGAKRDRAPASRRSPSASPPSPPSASSPASPGSGSDGENREDNAAAPAGGRGSRGRRAKSKGAIGAVEAAPPRRATRARRQGVKG